MSSTETHFGKLKKVETDSIEGWCKEKCFKKGVVELSSYNKDWQEQLLDEDYESVFIVNGEIWETIEHTEYSEDDDLCIFTKNEDGTVTFATQFYNGGTCLSEIIEEELTKIK